MLSRKDQAEKDLKAIMAKPIGAKNPIFEAHMIEELHSMFCLYADPRQRRAEMRDLLLTAMTLGLDKKYELVYRAITEIDEANEGQALDFEGFVSELTKKIGNPFTDEGREAHFVLLDVHGKGELDLSDLREINRQLHYGFDEQYLVELIQTIAGFESDTIPMHKFCRYVASRVAKRHNNQIKA
jgi:Ca2+-binding EF-hand superfamily protein